MLSPSYISDLSTSSYLKSKKYNKDCLFSKNLDEIRNNLLTLSKEKRLNNKDTSDVINNFVETYSSDKVNNTKPCIALIKRSTILKNELKDIQEIINNKDESIASSLSLIMESRYNSYEIENDIAPSEILLPILDIILVLKSVSEDCNEPKLISYLLDRSDKNTDILLINNNTCSYNNGTVSNIITKSEPTPNIHTVSIANHLGLPASINFLTKGYIT